MNKENNEINTLINDQLKAQERENRILRDLLHKASRQKGHILAQSSAMGKTLIESGTPQSRSFIYSDSLVGLDWEKHFIRLGYAIHGNKDRR